MEEHIKMTYLPERVPQAPSSIGNKSPLSIEQIHQTLVSQFGKENIKSLETAHKGDPFLVVSGDKIIEIAKFLRDNPGLEFVDLQVVSAVDYPGTPGTAPAEGQAAVPATPARIEVVYVLYSYSTKSSLMLKVMLSRENPQLLSLCPIYRSANWYERECYDMVGVVFNGHPNHQRILCPQDWVGFPLRKDYVFPEEYNGMKVPL